MTKKLKVKGNGKPASGRVRHRDFILAVTVFGVGLTAFAGCLPEKPEAGRLDGKQVEVIIAPDLAFQVYRKGGDLIWQSSDRLKPELVVRTSAKGEEGAKTFAFAEATGRKIESLKGEAETGLRIELSGFPESDVEVQVVLGLDQETDELRVQIQQSAGEDRIQAIHHFYCIDKPTSEGGYLVLPQGNGYLIEAQLAKKLGPFDEMFPREGKPSSVVRSQNIIGYRYTLPVFGMVKGRDSFYQIVDTYWDCSVSPEHVPGQYSSLDFNWLPSLGELSYTRKFRMRFAEGLDYVGMAKAYREYAREQGLLRTLKEKSKETPAIERYVEGIEYRVLWQKGVERKALRDIRRFQKEGLRVNFFFPKWSSEGYAAQEGVWNADGGWQSFLLEENPVPGGWKRLVEFARTLKKTGALIKVMMNPKALFEKGPQFDPGMIPRDENGVERNWPRLSAYFGPQVTRNALESLEGKDFHLDALYFDGFVAHAGMPEDHAEEHRLSRRESLEKEIESLRLARRLGVIPGAELPRFWAIADCDFFYFRSSWASEILPGGTPIPLFPLVFHECYSGCFSGGGYGTYDWPADRHPRLYELLFAASPAYNWMLPYSDEHPGSGFTEVPVADWNDERMPARLEWLKRWSAYYQTVAFAEMTTHAFLNEERTLQKVTFANGVTAEFDFSRGLLRVQGVEGFSGEWEKPYQGPF